MGMINTLNQLILRGELFKTNYGVKSGNRCIGITTDGRSGFLILRSVNNQVSRSYFVLDRTL